MKYVLVGLLTMLVISFDATAHTNRCGLGTVRGFATVTGDRLTGSGGVPASFSSAQRYFLRRYNCTRQLVQVRRLDRGIYEVSFPANPSVTPVASAWDNIGITASVEVLAPGYFRIIIRGAERIEEGIIPRRDSPFTIIIS